MRERVCRNCGGRQYKVVGQNMVKCQFCGTLYVDEQASKEEEFLTIAAYEKLRSCRFEEATSEFDKVLALYPMSFEGHFGKMQAKNKIVIYNNKRWERKVPRFFDDKIVSIAEDEDFLEAVKNAPQDMVANYNEIAKRIDRVVKGYAQIDKSKPYDVVVCAMDYDKDALDPQIDQFIDTLQNNNLSVYFLQGLEGKEREEETFFALNTAKVFVLFANSSKGYTDPTYKHLFDRYLYFITQKRKYAKSFIIALDEEKCPTGSLPADLNVVKNIIKTTEENFNDELFEEVKKQAKNTAKESAKIQTVTIEKVAPKKKEYVDIENVNPIDLGYYEVENLESGQANKIRWIFLSLKNSDFINARQNIDLGLEKDPNNAELLFADLLCEKQLHTAGEFFSSISNFTNKEKIDKILTYATKEFAEMFVDNWEKLVVELDSEEYYNAFLLYLAKFNTPYRDAFINAAENKAVTTLDATLIENVAKCFDKEDVDRFVNFYFMLAQHGDNTEYYHKVLEIDPGHKASNIALLLKSFRENGDILSYRNSDEIESVFKYLDEDARAQYVMSVTNIIMPLAFNDVERAEETLDFFLSYVTTSKQIASILQEIGLKFSEYGFFKQAEKYISLAISKDKENAQLYWELLKIKAHCKSDMDVISAPVDFTKMPEWDTILKLADEQQTEKYAEITSKAHISSAEKKAMPESMLDKVTLHDKLRDFLNRNSTILLERKKEDDLAATRGINYYQLQLVPIVNYFESLDNCSTFEEYKELYDRLFERLELLDLTLESSISAIDIANRGDGLKNIVAERERVKAVGAKLKTYQERTNHKKFWKNFLIVGLEWVPVAFTLLLLTMILIDPKFVYMYFPQSFVLILALYCVALAIGNMIFYAIRKKKLSIKNKILTILLMSLAFLSFIFMFVDFFLTAKAIEISSTKELSVMLSNANYSNLVLTQDLDLDGVELKQTKFHGNFDGNGYSLTNVVYSGAGDFAFFKTNSGEIKNLTIVLKANEYSKVKNFGGLVINNRGKITNCLVLCEGITLRLETDANVGGLAAENNGGEISGNNVVADFTIFSTNDASVGGLVGKIKNVSTITKNKANFNAKLREGAADAEVGGLAGLAERFNQENLDISQNRFDVSIDVSGESQRMYLGGIFGIGYCGSENNYANGTIILDRTSSSFAGGLYGWYNCNDNNIKHSYTTISITYTYSEGLTKGGLVGYGSFGSINTSYSSQNYELVGVGLAAVDSATCKNNVVGYFVHADFDTQIWKIINNTTFPTLQWEE